MTSTEAANYLGLSNYEDLDEAIEEQLFQCRQEIIQKADQVLLFPAKEKRFLLLQNAAESLGYSFPSIMENMDLMECQSVVIEERFQHFQANRSRLLKQAIQVGSFVGLVHIQQQLSLNYRMWSGFWTDLKTIPPQEIKLSSVLDSMRFLQVIHDWKKQGFIELQGLNEENIPLDIQVEILRLQQVFIKLN